MAIRKSRFLPLTTFPYGQSTALLQRVVVIGTSGSGTTTFARRLAAILSMPHIELDALHWEANWQEVPRPVLRARTRQATAAPRWVVDGNYSSVRDIVWPRATSAFTAATPNPSAGRSFHAIPSCCGRSAPTAADAANPPQGSLLLTYAHLTFWESRHPRDTEAFLEQLRFLHQGYNSRIL